MTRHFRRPLVFVTALLCAACARTPRDLPPSPVAGSGTIVPATRSASALVDFQPARPLVTSGGECNELRDPSTGLHRVVAMFPSRAAPESSIALQLSDSGSVARYTETRGVPQPSPSIEEMQRQLSSMIRTQIQIDFRTGSAMAVDFLPGEPPRAVTGALDDLEGTSFYVERQRLITQVRALCGV